MGDNIVGDEGLTFAKVVNTMEKSSVFEQLFHKWRDLIQKLKCSDELPNRIESKINPHSSYWTASIITDILIDWRSRNAHNAKLCLLIEALEKINLADISHKLKIEFVESPRVNAELTEVLTEPGKAIQEHLEYYLVDLLEATDLSPELVNDMAEKGVLDFDEVTAISQMRDPEDKNLRFYQFVLKRIGEFPDIFETMIQLFLKDNVNSKRGVVLLLSQYYDNTQDNNVVKENG